MRGPFQRRSDQRDVLFPGFFSDSRLLRSASMIETTLPLPTGGVSLFSATSSLAGFFFFLAAMISFNAASTGSLAMSGFQGVVLSSISDLIRRTSLASGFASSTAEK